MTALLPPIVPFADVPRTAAGQLGLYLYIAAARLSEFVRRTVPAGAAGGAAAFLGGYEGELARRMGGAAGDPLEALETWEAAAETRLPLDALRDELSLDSHRRLAFALAGLPEEDSRFGALFAVLQGGPRRPTVELTGRVAGPPEADAWTFLRPLVETGLAALDDAEAPRAERQLRVPGAVWDAARGELGGRPLPGARLRPAGDFPRIGELLHEARFVERLERLPRALRQGQAGLVVFRRAPGVDIEEIAGAVARDMGRGLLRLNAEAARRPEAGPLLALARALPLVEYELGPGETIDPPALPGYRGPILLAMGVEGGLRADREAAATLDVPFPSPLLREARWRRALDGAATEEIGEIRDRFLVAGGHIRTLAEAASAHAALEGRQTVRAVDVRAAGRRLNRQALDSLAQYLETGGRWTDLVASAMTRDRLAELEQRCRRRETLAGGVGERFRASVGRGVRALFAGASGTGKTMAARILAAELGMDLYRVDLASIVNKYVGETEKNLHQVLGRAEALDVVLLLDEGDALLGKRSEVKSSNDRYANLETNYLLQRLESYQGVALVTTNFAENIDPAFQRRMDVVVPFFPPRPDERRRIWELHLPAAHAVEPEWLERVVQRCALTGGQIRNAVLQAAALAQEAARPMRREHLATALLREYQKAGASFPLLGAGGARRERRGGLGTFVAAMRAR